MRKSPMRCIGLGPVLVAALGGVAGPALAEQLPLTSFTTSQGLSHNRVNDIYRCSRGYLWFSTPNGLSRFDGHVFVNYGREEGLEPHEARELIQTARGDYWVATGGPDLFYLDSAGTEPGRSFRRFPLQPGSAEYRVETVIPDPAGRLWAGTTKGLFVSERSDNRASFRRVPLVVDGLDLSESPIDSLLMDRRGTIWIGTPGLLRLEPGGRVSRLPLAPQAGNWVVFDLLEDRAGRIWAGHSGGVTIYRPPEQPADRIRFVSSLPEARRSGRIELPRVSGEASWMTFQTAQETAAVFNLHETRDGHLWLVTASNQMIEFDNEAYRIHDQTEGLNEQLVTLGEDSTGNLWIGSNAEGAQRLSRRGFTAFGRADGLGYLGHAVLIRSRTKGILLYAADRLHRLDRPPFESIAPRIPAEGFIYINRVQARVLEDGEGRWWFAAGGSVYRYPPWKELKDLGRLSPELVFGPRQAWTGDRVATIFEDTEGDIWIGLAGSLPVARIEGRTGRVRRYGESDGLPARSEALSFTQDMTGTLWVGLRGGVARLRGDRFESFAAAHGRPSWERTLVHVDGAGRLWIGRTGGGVARTDDPTADKPAFRFYSRRDGLASDAVTCLVEDRWNRIYVGGISGIDRIDPESGTMRHFSIADGLSNDEVTTAQRDADDALWFTSRMGVSRLIPQADDEPGFPPPVRIAGIMIAGEKYPLGLLGAQQIAGVRVSHARNRLQIDFGAIDFSTGLAPRYQYLLEGTEGGWSQPTQVPGIQLASLSAGSYRLLARAVDGEGRVSPDPASVSFVVLPPFWRTWWFVSFVVTLTVAGLAVLHTRRVARAVELERVRTRIATDLHDDIGASLSQIAILSEVVQTRLQPAHDGVTEPLSRIAASSRELVDTMGDIVWAINPRRDKVRDVAQRMRRFASETLGARGVEIRFQGPQIEDVPLGADIKRHLHLILKESVNNAARHSGCGRVEIDLEVKDGRVTLQVRDDGRGFDPGQAGLGQGLESMQRRARELGGSLTIASAPGTGTTIRADVPIHPPRSRWRRGASPHDHVG